MTVILVLGTFLVFILIDFFLNKKQTAHIPVTESVPAAPALLSSASIEGILVPDQLRYHSGHTWISQEREHLARVGADALAVRPFGSIDKIELPQPGRWVRQGQKAFTVWTGSEHVDLLSPAEGEVTEVNPEIARDPSLLSKDPYGRGWLVKVNMPDPDLVERNLLPKNVVRTWMREEVSRYRATHPVSKLKAINER